MGDLSFNYFYKIWGAFVSRIAPLRNIGRYYTGKTIIFTEPDYTAARKSVACRYDTEEKRGKKPLTLRLAQDLQLTF